MKRRRRRKRRKDPTDERPAAEQPLHRKQCERTRPSWRLALGLGFGVKVRVGTKLEEAKMSDEKSNEFKICPPKPKSALEGDAKMEICESANESILRSSNKNIRRNHRAARASVFMGPIMLCVALVLFGERRWPAVESRPSAGACCSAKLAASAPLRFIELAAGNLQVALKQRAAVTSRSRPQDDSKTAPLWSNADLNSSKRAPGAAGASDFRAPAPPLPSRGFQSNSGRAKSSKSPPSAAKKRPASGNNEAHQRDIVAGGRGRRRRSVLEQDFGFDGSEAPLWSPLALVGDLPVSSRLLVTRQNQSVELVCDASAQADDFGPALAMPGALAGGDTASALTWAPPLKAAREFLVVGNKTLIQLNSDNLPSTPPAAVGQLGRRQLFLPHKTLDGSEDLADRLVSLIFWYKDDDPAPIYTLDARLAAGALLEELAASNGQWQPAGGGANEHIDTLNGRLLASATHYEARPAQIRDGSESGPASKLRINTSAWPYVRLQLERVQARAAGDYKCRVDFRRARTIRRTVRLLVEAPVRELQLTASRGASADGQSVRLDEGQSVEFLCRAIGGWPRPALSWFISWPRGRPEDELDGAGALLGSLDGQIVHEDPRTAFKVGAGQTAAPAAPVASRLIVGRLARSLAGAQIGCRAGQHPQSPIADRKQTANNSPNRPNEQASDRTKAPSTSRPHNDRPSESRGSNWRPQPSRRIELRLNLRPESVEITVLRGSESLANGTSLEGAAIGFARTASVASKGAVIGPGLDRPPLPVREHQPISFVCRARGSWPAARLRWLWSEPAQPLNGSPPNIVDETTANLEGALVTNSAQLSADGDFVSESKLSFLNGLNRTDSNASLICQASNELLEADELDTKLEARSGLTVEFKPSVRLLKTRKLLADVAEGSGGEEEFVAKWAALALAASEHKAAAVEIFECRLESNPSINQLVWLVDGRPLFRLRKGRALLARNRSEAMTNEPGLAGAGRHLVELFDQAETGQQAHLRQPQLSEAEPETGPDGGDLDLLLTVRVARTLSGELKFEIGRRQEAGAKFLIDASQFGAARRNCSVFVRALAGNEGANFVAPLRMQCLATNEAGASSSNELSGSSAATELAKRWIKGAKCLVSAQVRARQSKWSPSPHPPGASGQGQGSAADSLLERLSVHQIKHLPADQPLSCPLTFVGHQQLQDGPGLATPPPASVRFLWSLLALEQVPASVTKFSNITDELPLQLPRPFTETNSQELQVAQLRGRPTQPSLLVCRAELEAGSGEKQQTGPCLTLLVDGVAKMAATSHPAGRAAQAAERVQEARSVAQPTESPWRRFGEHCKLEARATVAKGKEEEEVAGRNSRRAEGSAAKPTTGSQPARRRELSLGVDCRPATKTTTGDEDDAVALLVELRASFRLADSFSRARPTEGQLGDGQHDRDAARAFVNSAQDVPIGAPGLERDNNERPAARSTRRLLFVGHANNREPGQQLRSVALVDLLADLLANGPEPNTMGEIGADGTHNLTATQARDNNNRPPAPDDGSATAARAEFNGQHSDISGASGDKSLERKEKSESRASAGPAAGGAVAESGRDSGPVLPATSKLDAATRKAHHDLQAQRQFRIGANRGAARRVRGPSALSLREQVELLGELVFTLRASDFVSASKPRAIYGSDLQVAINETEEEVDGQEKLHAANLELAINDGDARQQPQLVAKWKSGEPGKSPQAGSRPVPRTSELLGDAADHLSLLAWGRQHEVGITLAAIGLALVTSGLTLTLIVLVLKGSKLAFGSPLVGCAFASASPKTTTTVTTSATITAPSSCSTSAGSSTSASTSSATSSLSTGSPDQKREALVVGCEGELTHSQPAHEMAQLGCSGEASLPWWVGPNDLAPTLSRNSQAAKNKNNSNKLLATQSQKVDYLAPAAIGGLTPSISEHCASVRAPPSGKRDQATPPPPPPLRQVRINLLPQAVGFEHGGSSHLVRGCDGLDDAMVARRYERAHECALYAARQSRQRHETVSILHASAGARRQLLGAETATGSPLAEEMDRQLHACARRNSSQASPLLSPNSPYEAFAAEGAFSPAAGTLQVEGGRARPTSGQAHFKRSSSEHLFEHEQCCQKFICNDRCRNGHDNCGGHGQAAPRAGPMVMAGLGLADPECFGLEAAPSSCSSPRPAARQASACCSSPSPTSSNNNDNSLQHQPSRKYIILHLADGGGLECQDMEERR